MTRKRESIEEKVIKTLKDNPHFSYQEACRFVLKAREEHINKLKKRESLTIKKGLTNKVTNTKKKKKPQKRKASIWTVSGGAVSPK
ncbi:MAG: hypothetical protein ACTH5C_14825 [Pseudoalteromonas prydzensis]|uniref:hypothetical protein n=1 Tax=Pseudoalteromonas prydzensis TaxID=182141 RepID=UPI003F9864B6